jgi:hypothetical protein
VGSTGLPTGYPQPEPVMFPLPVLVEGCFVGWVKRLIAEIADKIYFFNYEVRFTYQDSD